MNRLFVSYRVLALVVGVLLAFCSLVAFPLKYFTDEGSDLQRFGEDASIMWLFHGWIFMVYVVVAFLLSAGPTGRSGSPCWCWSRAWCRC